MAALTAQVQHPGVAARSWRGALSLVLAPRQERTVMVRRRHQGPFVVQSPFHPEGPVCHVVLLHPPGGVVGGDTLELDVRIERGGHALLTTPAATKVYRSAGPESVLTQVLSVADGATLEWLPQETIAFEGARARVSTCARLDGAARFIGWEITCLGRPACGEGFARGALDQSFEVWRGDEPLLLDRARWAGACAALDAPWGLGGQPVSGMLLASGVDESAASAARDAASGAGAARFTTTVVDGVLVCRYLGPSASQAHAAFVDVWAALRPVLIGRPACPPRIWAT